MNTERTAMSEEVLGELEQLDMTTIDIRILLDDHGYFDRRCPAAVCGAEFKILGADWKTKVSDDQVFCPICREEARAKEWQTLEQWRYLREVATGWARHLVGEALREEFETLNRRQPRDGFIRVSLSCEPSAPPVVLPLGAADAMRQKFTCEECGCQYAAIGAAFFCSGALQNAEK